jgi:hypothetical protein
MPPVARPSQAIRVVIMQRRDPQAVETVLRELASPHAQLLRREANEREQTAGLGFPGLDLGKNGRLPFRRPTLMNDKGQGRRLS